MGNPPKPNPIPTIKSRASDVREAADELTRRIRLFELWLSKLHGRVESSCVIGEDETGENQTLLVLEKSGSEWVLFLSYYNVPMEHESGRTLLRDASVAKKSWAVMHFPALLDAIVASQSSLITRAKESTKSFDEFAKSIGLKEGE